MSSSEKNLHFRNPACVDASRLHRPVELEAGDSDAQVLPEAAWPRLVYAPAFVCANGWES